MTTDPSTPATILAAYRAARNACDARAAEFARADKTATNARAALEAARTTLASARAAALADYAAALELAAK